MFTRRTCCEVSQPNKDPCLQHRHALNRLKHDTLATSKSEYGSTKPHWSSTLISPPSSAFHAMYICIEYYSLHLHDGFISNRLPHCQTFDLSVFFFFLPSQKFPSGFCRALDVYYMFHTSLHLRPFPFHISICLPQIFSSILIMKISNFNTTSTYVSPTLTPAPDRDPVFQRNCVQNF